MFYPLQYLELSYLCVELYSSTVKDSSNCKMSQTYFRGTHQRSCVVNIYLGASTKFLHLPVWKCHISLPKTKAGHAVPPLPIPLFRQLAPNILLPPIPRLSSSPPYSIGRPSSQPHLDYRNHLLKPNPLKLFGLTNSSTESDMAWNHCNSELKLKCTNIRKDI